MQVDNIHEEVKPQKYLLRLIISRVRDCWVKHTHKRCRCVYIALLEGNLTLKHKICMPFSNSSSRLNPKETLNIKHKETCTRIFTAAFSITLKYRKESNCPSTGISWNKSSYIHAMGQCVKRKSAWTAMERCR